MSHQSRERSQREQREREARGENPAAEFADDLARDAHSHDAPHTMDELAHPGAHDDGRDDQPREQMATDPDDVHGQHARTGQAESPREMTPNQPEKKRHHTG